METSPEPTNLTPAKLPPERQYVRRRRHDRPGVVFPLLLILLGVIFLLKNTGLIQGNVWEFVLRLWPVLLIALGLESLYQRRNLVTPVFWIGLGVVFLLSSMNLIALNILDIILRLWPLFLVAIGLDIFIGRRSIWLSGLGAIVLIVVMAGSLWVLAKGYVASTGGQPISQAINAAGEVQASLNPAIGTLNVTAIPATDTTNALVQGKADIPSDYDLSQNYHVNGTQGYYDLGLQPESGLHVFTQGWNWDLAFTGRVPLSFNVNMGAGQIKMDLSQLNVNGLNLSIGVGTSEVTLPAKGRFDGQLNSAIGQTTIHIPKDAPVRLIADGLSLVNAPSDFTSVDRIYTSPSYSTATSADQVTLQISQAIGIIQVEYIK